MAIATVVNYSSELNAMKQLITSTFVPHTTAVNTQQSLVEL